MKKLPTNKSVLKKIVVLPEFGFPTRAIVMQRVFFSEIFGFLLVDFICLFSNFSKI
jgi:hypothetical protein